MKNRLILSIVLPAAMVFATSAFAGSNEEKVQWDDVPIAAQKTITHHAEGGDVKEIEKKTKTKNGKTITIYEADVIREDGAKIEIKVRENGKLIKFEYD
ncbi:MAG: hypothetical protein ABIO50_00115 [Nitrosospira sp.]